MIDWTDCASHDRLNTSPKSQTLRNWLFTIFSEYFFSLLTIPLCIFQLTPLRWKQVCQQILLLEYRRMSSVFSVSLHRKRHRYQPTIHVHVFYRPTKDQAAPLFHRLKILDVHTVTLGPFRIKNLCSEEYGLRPTLQGSRCARCSSHRLVEAQSFQDPNFPPLFSTYLQMSRWTAQREQTKVRPLYESDSLLVFSFKQYTVVLCHKCIYLIDTSCLSTAYYSVFKNYSIKLLLSCRILYVSHTVQSEGNVPVRVL